MNAEDNDFQGVSRRQFLGIAGGIAVAAALPMNLVLAEPTTAKYRRLNLSNPAAPLESYKRAITKMLALPPSDPRNWYRNALIHTLDCPHGNWWFLPWHRGYLGWFEETCRELSGDPSFALSYWDWTAQPYIPSQFFEGVLDPNNPAYIDSYAAFQAEFTNPVSDFWKSLTPDQSKELSLRGYNTPADLWAQLPGMFFPRGQARVLTQANPNFDATTRRAVSITTVNAALAPLDFLSFGSDKAAQHSEMVGFGILEGQPHNNVHNNIGGFMGDFLSPVDPLFFAHHANIDRLWDVWTRKQQKLGKPTLPTGADLDPWAKEPFLFYINSAGKPVTDKAKAGDYATIGDFAYDYQPGSGEGVIPASPAVSAFSQKSFEGTLKSNALDFSEAVGGQIKVPEPLLNETRKDGPTLFAKVAIQPPADPRGMRFHVLLNAPEDAAMVNFEDPSYVASLEFFGKPHHAKGPVTFTVPLPQTMKALDGAKRLMAGEPLRLQVVPDSKGVALNLKAVKAGSLTGVSVGAF